MYSTVEKTSKSVQNHVPILFLERWMIFCAVLHYYVPFAIVFKRMVSRTKPLDTIKKRQGNSFVNKAEHYRIDQD